MPLSEEEIQAITSAENPAEHELIKPLIQKGLKIRTEQSETQFLDRFKNDVIEKTIPERIREVHDKYDQDVRELTGIDRKQDEKSYEYMKRAFKEKETNLASKIAELEKQATKGGDPDGVLKQQIDELKAQNENLQNNLQSKSDEIAQMQGKFEIGQKRSKLMNEYNQIKANFKKDLPDYFKVFENETLEKVLKNTREENGKLIPLNEDGTIMKDADLNIVDIKDVLKMKFKDALDTNKPSGTGGTGSSTTIDPETISVEDFQVPATIKNQQDLMTHMLELGLERGTKKFNEIYRKYGAKLPLR